MSSQPDAQIIPLSLCPGKSCSAKASTLSRSLSSIVHKVAHPIIFSGYQSLPGNMPSMSSFYLLFVALPLAGPYAPR